MGERGGGEAWGEGGEPWGEGGGAKGGGSGSEGGGFFLFMYGVCFGMCFVVWLRNEGYFEFFRRVDLEYLFRK